MIFNKGNIIKKEIIKWLNRNPDINYYKENNILKIEHPKKIKTYIIFEFNKNGVSISYANEKKIFEYNFFNKINSNTIFRYFLEDLIKKENREIKKPKLNKSQVAVLSTNIYGQVLTSTFNIFNGWGNVYKVFDNVKLAENYANELIVKEHTEIVIYNSNYKQIKTIILK